MKRILISIVLICAMLCSCGKKPLPVISVIDNKFNISCHDFSDVLYSMKSHKKLVEERMLVMENTASHTLERGVDISFRGEEGQTRRVNITIDLEYEAGDIFIYCFNDLIHLIYPDITDTDFKSLATSVVATFEEEDPDAIYYEDIRITCTVNIDDAYILIGIDGFGDLEPKSIDNSEPKSIDNSEPKLIDNSFLVNNSDITQEQSDTLFLLFKDNNIELKPNQIEVDLLDDTQTSYKIYTKDTHYFVLILADGNISRISDADWKTVYRNIDIIPIPEPNTFEAVDYLIVKGREDCKKLSDKQMTDIIKYLSDNYTSFYDSNATMETVIYYGALLEYGYRKQNGDYENLGMDVTNSVKDVYRNIETPGDHYSKINYEQVFERLQELGYEPK